jgi:hypothetical protein
MGLRDYDRILNLEMNRANARNLYNILMDVRIHRVKAGRRWIGTEGKTVQSGMKQLVLRRRAVLAAIDNGRAAIGVSGTTLTKPFLEL